MASKDRILIVEDEPIVALDIKSAITKLDYIVTDLVTNFDDAIKSVKYNEPNIVFMDINLGNSKDGIDTAKEIKIINSNIQIIYLTAYSDDKTMTRAIKTNPSNYLIKPFKREELKSSILLSKYKMNTTIQNDLNYNHKAIGHNYYFDMKNDNLFYKDQPVKLSTKEKKFLKLLVESFGIIVPFSTFELHLWSNSNVSDSTFRTLVYRLRSKLEFKLIETIPSFGYRLNI